MKWFTVILCACLLCACVKNRQPVEILHEATKPPVAVQAVPQSQREDVVTGIQPAAKPPSRAAAGMVYRVVVQGKSVATAFVVVTANPRLSGFSVLVTAAHALADVQSDSSAGLTVEGVGKMVLPVVRHVVSKDIDAAVLIVKASLPAAPVGKGAAVDAVCHSENYSFFPPMIARPRILSKGYIIDATENDIWAFLMPFAQGGSGAPLMVGGAVVGLVNQKVLDENKYPTGIVHALTMQSVMRFVDALR